MNKAYQNTQVLKYIFLAIAMIIVIVSTFFTYKLAKALSIEERKKVETTAAATGQLTSLSQSSETGFILKILSDNTTIPVILTDAEGNIYEYRNFEVPEKKQDEFLKIKAGISSQFNDDILLIEKLASLNLDTWK